MKHTLSNFVAILCLLAFFVSSAACLVAPLAVQSANEMHTHSMSGTMHACCPTHTPADGQVSNACCTVHHQPASVTSTLESQQQSLPALAAFTLPAPIRPTANVFSSVRTAPQQYPPLIALRI